MPGLADIMRRWADDLDADCPFYASGARAVAATPELVERIGAVPPGRHHPTLLFAALHDIVLAGTDHEIGEFYARAEPGEEAARAVVAAFDDLWPEVRARLEQRNTQTNEPNRASVLRPAINCAADGGPIALVDVGTSAGLNLMLDRYAYDYEPGGVRLGDRRSAVRLRCEIRRGNPPVEPDPHVAYRIGVDRDPVAVDDPLEERWLKACLWPGQHERKERLAAALRAIRADRPPVIKGDAVETLPALLDDLPEGILPVMVTTWVLAYMSKPQRAAFYDALADASRRRPVAWISLEGAGVPPGVPEPPSEGVTDSVLGLVQFRAGEAEGQTLGIAHPHGNWLIWL